MASSLGVSQLCDICQPVRTLAEGNVTICYQQTTSEDKEDLCASVTVIC
jgi:hypothetical protein